MSESLSRSTLPRSQLTALNKIKHRRYNPFPLIHIQSNERPKNKEGCHDNPWFSGLDANEWRCIPTLFGQQSVEISKTLATIAHKISTETLSRELLEPFNVWRLIPLDKNPGVRPISTGEIIRRIKSTTMKKWLKSELILLGSNYQLCLGQKCSIEYATQTPRK